MTGETAWALSSLLIIAVDVEVNSYFFIPHLVQGCARWEIDIRQPETGRLLASFSLQVQFWTTLCVFSTSLNGFVAIGKNGKV